MQEAIRTDNDFSLLKPMHSLIAGLKSVFTTDGFDHIRVMREAVGAIGILNASAMPLFIDVMSPLMTLEGDFVVMMQQVTRYVMK